MSDIFIIYAGMDILKTERLRAAFEREHWTVWRNPPLVPDKFDRAVIGELESAKVVVVLWSRSAEGSRWVRNTLKRASPLRLVFVRLEEVEVPAGFASSVVLDLSDWDGEVVHEGLQRLLLHLRALIAVSPSRAEPPVSSEGLWSKSKENALLGIKEGAEVRPEGGTRFCGVFISYRRNEAAAYAGRLYDRLAARFGKEQVFIDTENVGWGEDFVEVITSAAETCAVMIVLVSHGWSRGAQAEVDDYVRLEVAKALGRKVRVIPILIQGASMPAARELPADLAPLVRRNALALSDTRWERDVEDLIKSLENLL